MNSNVSQSWKYFLLGGLGATSLHTRAQEIKTDQPNIILIMTDQHRFDALGCIEGSPVISPNIDSLAADGHLFSNAYSASPSSTPARAGMLTGMSPWHHGMLGYGKVAEQYPYEMPQMLHDIGYKTIGIGKMHWEPQNALHGFEMTLLDESGRVESPNFMSDYRKWFNIHACGLNPDSTGIEWNAHGAAKYLLPEELHPTTWTGNQAVSLIKNYSSNKPLFLKVSFARPHSPYDPPQRYINMYQDSMIPNPIVGEWCKEMPLDEHPEKKPENYKANYGDEYARNSRKHYYASITMIDDQVGRIISELKRKGMYDNALICFVSDHGDMLGDHHLWRKTYAYEGSSAIPYIVKFPTNIDDEVTKGVIIDEPVELRDLLPTYLAINNQPIPDAMDGLSLLELLKKDNIEWRKYIDIEHSTAYWHDNYWCALTDGKIKYIWFFKTGEEQLFDLTKDPYEHKDLSKEKKSKKNLESMRKAMASHLQERGDEWVKDGQLMTRSKNLIYSPNYPNKKK